MTNIVAIQDGNIETAGAITYWRLSGDVSIQTLAQVWEDAGLDPKGLPGLPGAETALKRSLKDLAGPHQLVRPLKGSGYALVNEVTAEEGNVYDTGLRARLSGESVVVSPTDHVHTTDVLTGFERYAKVLIANDISSWLTRVVRRVGAVPLRDTGGMYFVPRHRLDDWRAVARALRAASSHVIFEIPALRSDEAVEAILDAVQVDAEREAKGLEEDLQNPSLTARGLKGKARTTERMLAKVESYEGLLGRTMDGLRKRIEDLKASITVAIMAAESEEAA